LIYINIRGISHSKLAPHARKLLLRGGDMRSCLLRLFLIAPLLLTAAASVDAEQSAPLQLQEELWALPLELPTLACVVRPVGKGPFPLAIMNHGVSLNAKEWSFFPLIEFRDAAFWFAHQGYLLTVATTIPLDQFAAVHKGPPAKTVEMPDGEQ
jgi:hypothetical protein